MKVGSIESKQDSAKKMKGKRERESPSKSPKEGLYVLPGVSKGKLTYRLPERGGASR